VRQALLYARKRIEAAGSDERELEAELLVMHALGIDRVHLYQRLAEALPEPEVDAIEAVIERRARHEPTAYITGHREFFGLDFEVTPAAIIPRAETEILVELTTSFAREKFAGRATIADVGTGSGAIAVALAVALPESRIIAIDESPVALTLAGRNAARHGVDGRIDFRHGDLLEPLTLPADIIAANLPYVTTSRWEAMPPEIREHEPRSGLDGGADGLDVIRRLLATALAKLAANGALFCEIGDEQGRAARELATQPFTQARIVVEPDLAGRDRVLAVYT
jgi:release factor glutamine methyltransferase